MTTTPDIPLDKADTELAGLDGAPLAACSLYYDRPPGYEVRVVYTPDRMRAYMKLTPGPGESISSSQILEVLREAGVTSGIIRTAVELYAALQSSAKPVKDYVQLARGEPMRLGEDGSIEFHVQPTAPQARYDANPDGVIDYKQLNLIENCFAGQRVATTLPPGPGRPGLDIFGDVIPAIPGSPINVQAGPGVIISSNGRDFTSDIEGRVTYEDGLISVSPVLEILHDIDYSVGNVDFVGKVVVKGNLLDGFYINARKGVEISGDMGAARITSDGDVKIAGGVKGKSAALIACRKCSARYIDDATVEAAGDVSVTKEIMNSVVLSLGRVSIPEGSIIGGEVCGFQGVEADTLGSEMGVPTSVVAGVNWADENQLAGIRERITDYLDRTQSSQVLLGPLLDSKDILAKLGAEEKTMLSELISELKDLRDELAVELEERGKINSHRQDGMVNQINVRKMVNQGVDVRFSLIEHQVKDAVKGPVSITQDEARKAAKFASLVSLPKLGGEEEE